MIKGIEKRKTALFTAIALILCVAVAAACAFAVRPSGASAQTEEGEAHWEQSVKTEYFVGDEFTVPETVIKYNGKDYAPSETYVYLPNGSAVSSKTLVLSIAGKYVIKYVATDGALTVAAEKEITVKSAAYSLTSSKSSVEFVDSLKMAPKTSPSGLHLRLAEGDEFVFNQPINLAGGDTTTPFMKFYSYNSTQLLGNEAGDHAQVRNIIVTLTDCYDPSVYVSFEIEWFNNSRSQPHPYYRAGANGQYRTGLLEKESGGVTAARKEIFIGGTRYVCYYGSDYGTYGNKRIGDNVGFTLFYDWAEKRVYALDSKLMLITDLDNPDIYPNNSFGDFTTGEVYLSVKADTYEDSVMDMEIERIGGLTQGALDISEITDDKDPVIEVDADTDKKMYIAKGKPFEVFSASAYDVNLKGMKTAVYYGFGGANQSQVGITDGKFTPNYTGVYTIVYTATDYSGRVAERKAELTCVDCGDGGIIDFSTDKISSPLAGATVTLPEYSASSLNGEVSVKIYASFEGGEKTPINADSRSFLPLNVGEYEIIYEFTDGVVSDFYSYKINVDASDKAIIGSCNMPNYFIKGARYTVDNVYAMTFLEKEPKYAKVKSEMKSDDGEYKEIDLSDFVITASEKVRFRFSYNEEKSESAEYKAVDVGFGDRLDFGKYFVGDFDYSPSSTRIEFTSKTGISGNVELDFINVISLSKFALNFTATEGEANYSAVKILLTDYNNRNNTIGIRLRKDGTSLAMSVNGGTEYSAANAFYGSHSVWIDGGAVRNNNGFSIETDMSGFSDKVLLKIVLEDVTEQSKIGISQVNNQRINNRYIDTIDPTVTVNDSSSGLREINETVRLLAPEITDELTPYLAKNAVFKVSMPSGGYATSVSGVLLDGKCPLADYDVKLTEYGTYRVEYTYTDQSGKSYTSSFLMNVEDRVAPELTLADGYGADKKISAGLGQEVAVAGYTVSDNITETGDLKVMILAYSPYYEMKIVENGKFTPDRKGDWRVCYYCYDSAGNYSTRYYVLSVA